MIRTSFLTLLLYAYVTSLGVAHASTTVSGAHRILFENVKNPFRPGRVNDESLTSLRTNLKIVNENDNWTFVAELQDSRAYGIEDTRNLNVGSVNAVEPLQYYAHYQTTDFLQSGYEAGIKVGRFTSSLGSKRLVGRNVYRNTLFTFMGAQAQIESPSGNKLDAFWMMSGQIRPNTGRELDNNDIRHDRFDDDLWIAGLFAENTTWLNNALLRGYVIGLHEKDSPGIRESHNRELFTYGGQILSLPKAGRWDVDIEGALQRGSQRASNSPNDITDLDVFAGFLHLGLGYTFTQTPLNVALTYDYASGDKDEFDDRSQLFDTLFGPIKGDLGPTGQFTLVHRNNLKAPGLRVKYSAQHKIQLMFHWQGIWLDSPNAPFGRLGIRDASGNSGDFAGQQFHASLKMPLSIDGFRLELGAVHFENEEFFNNAPNATGNGDPFFFFSLVEYVF